MVQRFRIIVSVVVLASCSTAFAWNKTGHQLVAAIAYDQLDPTTRAAYVELLRQHPRFKEDFQKYMPTRFDRAQQDRWIFVNAATWPDAVRRPKNAPKPEKKDPREAKWAYHRPLWHYINEPVYADEDDAQSMHPDQIVNLKRGLGGAAAEDRAWNILQALEWNFKRVNDEQLPAPDRAVSLCWVLHLIGDLHQPLHSSALFSPEVFPKGDHGGNSIAIAKDADDRDTTKSAKSLHSVWDGSAGERLSYSQLFQRLRQLRKTTNVDQIGGASLRTLAVYDWLQESCSLAREVAYNDRIIDAVLEAEEGVDDDDDRRRRHVGVQVVSMPPEYFEQAKEVSTRRVIEAGYRLAAALKAKTLLFEPARSAPPIDMMRREVAEATTSTDNANAIGICSFNIQFLGQSKRRDNSALAELLKDYDIVAVEELIAPPYAGTFPNGDPYVPNLRAAEFFDEMSNRGFSFVLSEEDTGKGIKNHLNSTATEWWAVFYKPNRVQVAADLPSGFLAADRTHNADFDRVPCAFPFRTSDKHLDFVLVPVHLRPSAGTANAARRKHELASIASWINANNSHEHDFIILGDMNIENAAELASDTPSPFTSANASCAPTNTNVNGPKPYDHVMFNSQTTTEFDNAFGFQVVDLIEEMRGSWDDGAASEYPGDPYDHNAFRAYYTDHNPVVVQLKIPDHDDDS